VTDVHVPSGQWGEAEPGEMVVVAITTWPTASRGPVGKVAEVLGDIDEQGVDTEIIIRKYGISDVHGDAAIEEALSFGPVSAKDIVGRTDFRHTVTVTIDGEHARDFDDAISIETLPNGHYWLGVHIADVAHYVTEGSALDQEGYERATSVYFPERAVHMFPSELATGICSLNPRVDRLVQTCLMEVDASGSVVRYEFHDGVINTAAAMLDKPGLDAAKKLQLTRMLRAESMRVARLVQDFLQLSRHRPPKLETMDPVLPLERSLVASLAGKDSIAVHRDFRHGNTHIEADTALLQQAWSNIFANSIEAMTQTIGAELRLTSRLEERTVVLTVEDNGPGIAADILPRLFEPFFTTKVAGTGLGLSIAYSLVEANGGQLEALAPTRSGAQLVMRFPISDVPIDAVKQRDAIGVEGIS